MRAGEFEQAVFELEGIVIRIRASRTEEVGDYTYQRSASDETSITEWMKNRIYPKLGKLGVCVIDGNYQEPHGLTRLRVLRSSYDRG